jgi:hypothetical protein
MRIQILHALLYQEMKERRRAIKWIEERRRGVKDEDTK